MPLQVKVSPRAAADLERQYEWYLEHASSDVAEGYLQAFASSITALAMQPQIGTVPKFKASRLVDIRMYLVARPFEKHLIFYRCDATTLSIIRVMHSARDLPRRLLDRE